MRNRKYSNKSLPIIVYTVMSVVLIILTIFLPKNDDTQNNEKDLASFPKFDEKSISNKEHLISFEEYMADNFILKEPIIASKTLVSRLFFNTEINDVFVTNNSLYKNIKNQSCTIAYKNIEAIEKFCANKKSKNSNLAIVPSASAIYKDDFTNDPNMLSQDLFLDQVYKKLKNTSFVDIYTKMTEQKSQKLFYNTDTMWTSQGAYVAYSAISSSLNIEPYQRDFFNIRYVKYDFYGDLYERLKLPLVPADTIELHEPSQITNLKIQVDKFDGRKNVSYPSMYFTEYLDSETPLNIFMGDDNVVTTITTNITTENEILIFGDDLTDALMQFLTLHYKKITIVDLSEITQMNVKKINFNTSNTILFLYGIENFITDNSIGEKLNLLYKE